TTGTAPDGPRVVLITSSVPNEGKTAIALSLARALAMSGVNVLLIDGDLRRPAAHRILGVPQGPGLTDLLCGRAFLEDAIVQDPETPAKLLPAGTTAPNPQVLLASPNAVLLFRSLKQQFDFVIIDSAPVLAVADARLLSPLAERVIYVVRWAGTRRATAANGLKQINQSGAEVAGVVLSMVDTKKHARYDFGDSGLYHGSIKAYYGAAQ